MAIQMTQLNSNISDLFASYLNTFSSGEKIVNENDLLFTIKEATETSHPLTRLFRMILATLQVTTEEFDTKHRQFAESAGYLQSIINYDRNNTKKSMKRPNITYRIFEHVIGVILGYNITDIMMTLKDNGSGKETTFTLKELVNTDDN